MNPILLDRDTVLRPLASADAVATHALITANRAHLDQWLRWSSAVQTLADVEALIARFEEQQRAGNGFHLGIWHQGQLAGGCVCWYIHRQNRNSEIGYWLAANATGRGLAGRSAAAVRDYLFETEQLHRIEMQCAVENHASRAIPERLGFRLEGIRRESHWITTRFLDHAVYGQLEQEWHGATGVPSR